MADKKKSKVVTPEFRLAFPSLFVPQVNRANPAAEAKYGCTMLIPKTVDVSELKALMLEAAKEKWGQDLAGLKGAKLESPIKNGDEKPEWDGYPGHFYIRAVTKIQPVVVDQNVKVIAAIEGKRVYAGCYCKAQVHCFAWENSGKKGVSFGVDCVQLVRDGEPFAGVTDATKIFGVVEGGKDDPKNYPAQPAGAPSSDPFAS